MRKHPETFCLTLLMRKSRSARLLVNATSGMLGEAQHGLLVFLHPLPQIVGVGLGDLAALALLTRWNRRKLALALGEDGAVAFLHGLVLALAQSLLVTFGDFVAGVEEQALHALGPGVVMGLDDEGEFTQQMRAA